MQAFLRLDEAAQEAHLHAREDADAELHRLGDEAERLVSGDPGGAAAILRDLRGACRRDASRSRSLARAARGETLALAYLGRFAEAIELAEQARAEAASGNAATEAARLRLAAMQPLLKLGRSDEAILHGESATQELEAAGEPALAARARINLGNVLKTIGRSSEALEQLDAAIAALAAEASLVATIENTRGEALLQLDRFAESRSAFIRAIEHFKAAAQPFAWAVAEGNLADLSARIGDLAEAFERFAAARERLPAQAAGHAARLLLEEGEVFEASGLPGIAIERLESAADRLAALGLAFESGRAALAIARTRLSMGLDEDALAALERLGDWRRDERNELRGMALEAVARSGLAARAGDDVARAAAIESADRLAAAVAAAAPSLDRIVAGDHLAQAFERLGRIEAALAAARESAETADRLELSAAISVASTTRARLERRAGLQADAIASARRAVASIERTRVSFGADRLRSAFLGSRLGAYEELVLSLVEQGGDRAIEEAFEVAELARSRTLIERLFGSLSPAADEGDPEAARLRERLQVLHARLASMARDDARSVAIDPIRAELVATESALERRLSERAGATASRGSAASPSTSQGWRASLAADEAFVEYFEAAGRLLAFVATRDGVRVVRLSASLGELEDLVAKAHFRIRRRLRSAGESLPRSAVDVDGLLARIAGRIWTPLAEALGEASHVIVAPHGCLHAVPFAALAVSDRERAVSIVPAAAAWARLAEPRTESASGDLLIVGVADAAAPRIDDEVAAIASAVGGSRRVRVLAGADATAAAVLAQLADPQVAVAHLACHGQFLLEAPQASGLRVHDRWISVREVAALPRTPSTVLLSGCDTGSVAVMPGEELLGLPRAFLAGGTRRLTRPTGPRSSRSDTLHECLAPSRRFHVHPRSDRDRIRGVGRIRRERGRRSRRPHRRRVRGLPRPRDLARVGARGAGADGAGPRSRGSDPQPTDPSPRVRSEGNRAAA